MVGDVPHEPSVFGIRVPLVVELDVVGARSVRVGDLRLRLSAGTADDVRCAMYVRIVNLRRVLVSLWYFSTGTLIKST